MNTYSHSLDAQVNKVAFFLFISIVISKFVGQIPIIGLFFKYADELVILLFVTVVSLRITVNFKVNKELFYLLVFLLLMLLMSAVSKYSPSMLSATIQGISYLKLPIFFYFLTMCFTDSRYHKIIHFAFYFSVLGILFNIVLGDYYYTIFDVRERSRGILIRLSGFQLSPNTLGMIFCFFYFYSLMFLKGNKKILWVSVSIVAVLFSGGRTALMLLIILHFTYQLYHGLSAKAIFSLIFPIILVVIFFLLQGDAVTEVNEQVGRLENATESGYMRAVMIYGGFMIATNEFPFGGGLASFGTPLSYASDIYKDYGLTSVKGIREFIGGDLGSTGIYDSNIAALFGELGFIGSVMYLAALYWYFSYFYKKHMINKKVLLSLLFAIVITSFTKPVFFESYIVFVMALILSAPLHASNTKIMNKET